MNANEITFGVEIECYIPNTQIDFTVGSYHCGRQVAALPRGWNAQSDGSLYTPPGQGYQGVEIVSGILKGEEGLAQIKLVCDWLKAKGAKVNASCGLHVHIGFANQPARALAQLVSLVAKNEKALYAITGTKSRERSHFCSSINAGFRAVGETGNINRRPDRSPSGNGARYHLLNLERLARGLPTVEFRCFSGSTNALKIQGFVQVCVGLVQKALKTKGKVKYDAKPLAANSRVTCQGEGETAANRLFYQLFWKFGDDFRPTSEHPKWAPLGVINPSTLKRAGKLLLNLAKKYDGNDDAAVPPRGTVATPPV